MFCVCFSGVCIVYADIFILIYLYAELLELGEREGAVYGNTNLRLRSTERLMLKL